jgi:hypothetical protein
VEGIMPDEPAAEKNCFIFYYIKKSFDHASMFGWFVFNEDKGCGSYGLYL